MSTQCLVRPRVQAFGFAVEGAQLSCPLRQRLHHAPFHPVRVTSSSGHARSTLSPVFLRRFASKRQVDKSKTQATSSYYPAPPHVEQQLSEVLNNATALSQSTIVPSEDLSEEALQSCERLAETLAGVEVDPNADSHNPTSSLLDLDHLRKPSESQSVRLTRATRDRIAEQTSQAAYTIITTPQVFITPELLATYVDTQALLSRPETIPPILLLYASKPIPQPNTSPVEYAAPNANKASSAVPLSAANTALDAAIDARNLPICFDIVNTTVCAPAFRRNKLVRRALIPGLGAAIAPGAAYSAASQWAVWQDTMDNQMARNVMFAGLLAYIGFTASIGVVAVTTSNDQMDRVTWASGTPLRERWLREEERAMADRVAGAWGFQESWRRGEEEGPDWQKLREWTGLRGMVLDKVALMEGME